MNAFLDKLNKINQEPPKYSFAYEEGQAVRVLKSLQFDTYYIQDLLGQIGIVSKRFYTGIHKELKYEVTFPNGRTEQFDEDELDSRYRKESDLDEHLYVNT